MTTGRCTRCYGRTVWLAAPSKDLLSVGAGVSRLARATFCKNRGRLGSHVHCGLDFEKELRVWAPRDTNRLDAPFCRPGGQLNTARVRLGQIVCAAHLASQILGSLGGLRACHLRVRWVSWRSWCLTVQLSIPRCCGFCRRAETTTCSRSVMGGQHIVSWLVS